MNENEMLREAIEVYKGTVSALSAARAEDQENHRKEVDALNARIMELTAQVAWLKRQLFGSKREKLPVYAPSSPDLFADQFADLLRQAESDRDGGKAAKEYLWMVRSVMERLVLFHYADGSRAGAVIEGLVNKHHFKGYLQCEGFAGYETAFKTNPAVTLVNCMVHIRRHFEQSLDENCPGRTTSSVAITRRRGTWLSSARCLQPARRTTSIPGST